MQCATGQAYCRPIVRALGLAILLSVAVLGASAHAATITVSTQDDAVANDGQCSLREAITAANTNTASGAAAGECPAGDSTDTVSLPGGTYKITRLGADDTNANGDFDLTSDIELAGAGRDATTISADGHDRVLDIIGSSVTVTVRGVTITGGQAPNGADQPPAAGGAGAAGSGLPGTAGEDGGGIRNAGHLTVADSRIADNHAGSGGHGGSGQGGGGSFGSDGGDGTGGNGGAGGAGGGINSSGPLVVADTVLSGNTAGAGGAGGAGTGGAGGTGNSPSPVPGGDGGVGAGGQGGPGGFGGGIFAGGTLTLTRVTISGNAAGTSGAGGTAIGGNGGDGSAGGVGGGTQAGSSIFGGAGGGVWAGATTTMVDSTVTGNHAGDGGAGGAATGGLGGGPASSGNGGTSGVANAGTGGNGGPGGGVFAFGGLTVSGSTFDHNVSGAGAAGGSAQTRNGGDIGPLAAGHAGAANNAHAGNSGSGGRGGAIAAAAALNITNATITANVAGAGAKGGDATGGSGGSLGVGGLTGGAGGNATSGDGGDGGSAGGVSAANGSTAIASATLSANQSGAPGSAGAATAGTGTGGASPGTATPGTNGAAQATTLAGVTGTTVTDSIVAGAAPVCGGTLTDGGHDIGFGDASCPGTHADPLLGDLADNGGPTKTQALGAGSPARDAGDGCPATDQRGMTRPQGAGCDIGAYEVAPPVAATGDSSAITDSGATVAGTVTANLRTTTAHFEYGPTTSYGSATPDAAASGAVAAPLSGLPASTTIHYRLVATSGDGTSAGEDRTFTTAATPVPPVNTPPVLSGVSLTHIVFAVAKGPTALTAAKKKAKPKRGTTFRYTLSEAARVTITIRRAAAGRRQGKRCVKPTRKLRRAKRCTRYLKVGTLTRAGKQGANRVPFSGRIGTRKLAKGGYRAVLSATDAEGARSKSVTLSFRVV